MPRRGRRSYGDGGAEGRSDGEGEYGRGGCADGAWESGASQGRCARRTRGAARARGATSVPQVPKRGGENSADVRDAHIAAPTPKRGCE